MPKKDYREDSIKLFQFLARKKIMRHVIPLLFTEGEQEDMVKRIAVIGYFKAGYSQRDIADALGVSLSFVTRTLKRMRRIDDVVKWYAQSNHVH